MTSPAATALRAEIVAALDTLTPQIRGLEDLAKVSLSQATLAFVQTEIADHTRRRTLCNGVLAALDALEADDWPEMPKAEVPASSFQELQEQQSDIAAALSEFEAEPLASNIAVNLGGPTDKPQS